MVSDKTSLKKVYLTPKNKALFEAYVNAEDLGNSDALNSMVKFFFQSLTDKNRLSYLDGTKQKMQVSWPV